MIELSLKFSGKCSTKDPFVCIFTTSMAPLDAKVAVMIKSDGPKYQLEEIQIISQTAILEENEILLVFPEQMIIQRFYRPSSNSNTILVTERCDQYCMMCSQPPKSKDYLHWELYLTAASVMPHGSTLGISGGEPTLYKKDLFAFLIKCKELDRNLRFHVLTNAQHFNFEDIPTLEFLNETVVWGIPIYSDLPNEHDKIVGKTGAFKKLQTGFEVLLESCSRVELRTVLLQENHPFLARLAKYVSRHVQWIETWAIMQLEPIGFAKISWQLKFVDTSIFGENLEQAVNTAKAAGISIQLYNFPTCVVPESIRQLCVRSISDWKQKYLLVCKTCSEQKTCSGFFEWYVEEDGFEIVQALTK